MGTNWKLMRNEYEIAGTSVKELCASHHVSAQLVNHAIKEDGWSQKDLETLDLESHQEKTRAMDILHQTTLVPKFILLQGKMLEKCDNLLDEVKTLDDAMSLKIVSDVIEKHRPSIMGVKKEESQDTGITVKVLTQIGGGELPQVSAVEVSSSAGKTNGIGEAHSGHGKYLTEK